jgi:chitin deacetylase
MLKQRIEIGYQPRESWVKTAVTGGAMCGVAILGAVILANPMSKLIATPSQKQALIDRSMTAFNKTVIDLATAEQTRRLNAIPAFFQSKVIKAVQLADADDKAIALTFDDGPWPESTNEILYILKQNNVRATFFVLGSMVQQYPQQVKNMVEDGHSIGNHTWSHRYHFHSDDESRQEIENTAAAINKVSGVKTALFRPPGGFLDNGLSQYAQEKQQVVVMWSTDSGDSANASAQRLLDNVITTAKPGGIVLLHDGGGDRSKTVWALPKMIEELRQQGYRFVTVPELLELEATVVSDSSL